MSNSSKGIFVVIGGAVLLAVLAGAVYFTFIGPRGEKKRMQKEIEKWGVKWEGARDCLVGPDPRSADGFEAVVLREALSTEDMVPALRECDEELKGLRRQAGYSAGEAVEAAWTDSQAKVTALAEAFAWRTGKTPNRPVAELRAALGKAVAELDAAYGRLRDKAGLDQAARAGEHLPTLPAGRTLADARGTPIVPEDIGVSGNVVFAVGSIGDRKWLVRDRGDGAPQVIPIGAETLAGLDGGGWGIWREEPDEEGGPVEIRSGAVDEVGDPSGDGALIARLDKGLTGALWFALASDPVRVAVYESVAETGEGEARIAFLARSRDGGATWPEKVQLARDHAQVVTDLAQQRADLFFHGPDGAPRWLVLDPGSIAGPLQPARVETPETRPCVAGARTWWLGDDSTIYASEEAGQPLRPVPGSSEGAHSLVCAGDRLLALTDSSPSGAGQKILVCRATGCSATTIPAAPGARTVAALGEKRGPLVASEAEGVVVVSSGDPEKKQDFKPIEVARLTGEQQLAGVVEWKGAVHLVTRTARSLHVVPVGK
ncbi:MAG TPA: hypothetical protein VFU21_07005 [Kofleriaceae bacterium]|nr:hypothetical protein [Kofleriaceae bacterium]